MNKRTFLKGTKAMIPLKASVGLLCLGLISAANIYSADFAQKRNLPQKLKGDISVAAIQYIQQLLPEKNQAKLENTYKDEFGYTYIRVQQYYSNVPIEDARIILHIDPNGVLYKIGGTLQNDIDVKNMDKAILPEKAIRTAQSAAITMKGRMRISPEDTLLSESKTAGITADKPRMVIRGNRLLYKVFAHEGSDRQTTFEYIVDALSGKLIGKSDAILDLTPPSTNGYHTTVQGQFLPREVNPENGINTTSFSGWRDNPAPQHYFLYNYGDLASRKGGFGILNCYSSPYNNIQEWEQSTTSNWGSSSPSAISAGKNASIVQNWLLSFLNLYSVDNSGLMLTFYINYRKSDVPFCNASYLPGFASVALGDGDNATYGNFGVLDIIAHEMGHAVTQFSSNLGVGGEPRALNESYSDIMATTIEFMTQSSAASNYPYTMAGKADWLIGEDVVIGKTAVRDLRIGQREMSGGSLNDLQFAGASYYNGSRYWEYDAEGAWYPYQGSQVQSFAFYLLSEGASSTFLNDGHPYGPFQGIGIQNAARIAMRANLVETTSHDCLIDSRAAWIRAAEFLVQQNAIPSNSVQLVNQVWDAVGVTPGISLRFVYTDHPHCEIGPIGNMKLGGWCQEGYTPPLYPGHGYLAFTSPSNTIVAVFEGPSVLGDRDLNIQGNFTQDLSNNFDNLSGKLVVRGPDGRVHMTLDQTGNIQTREKRRNGILY